MLRTVLRARSGLRKFLPLALTAAVFAGGALGAHAQSSTPSAGSTIGNRASATYTDGGGVIRTATSNETVTTVQQVAALTLVANRTLTAAPNAPVYFAHTVTNNGNGNDVFTLTAVNAAGSTFSVAPAIYADANGDGVPDDNTVITQTPNLAPGQSFSFVVSGQVPAAQASATTSTTTVQAKSVFDTTQSQSNTDKVTVTPNAVVNLTKAIDQTSGPSPSTGSRTYTLTYTNNGSTSATNVVIGDVLPTQVTYVAGSGIWSDAPSTALTDLNDSGVDPAGINYTFNTGTKVITATLASVAPGTTANITFKVNVNSGLTPQNISNVATVQYNDGGASGGTTVGPVNSNPAIYRVNQVVSLTFVGPAVDTPSANPGDTISFTNVLTNTGSGNDSFDIVVNNPGSFPANTTFALFKSDGVTPLVDTNGNGVADTGIVAAGASYNVILKATLPTGAVAQQNGPYAVTKTATSFVDPTKTKIATDKLTTISASSVDIKNSDNTGAGAGAEALSQATLSGNPGTTVTFPLVVVNGGNNPDTFALSYSSSTTPGTALPAGYQVVFHSGSATGPIITNTGTIAGNGSVTVYAVVTIPANSLATPATGAGSTGQDIYFRAASPTSGNSDTLHDAVKTNNVNSLTVTPNRQGQVYQGGSIVYAQTITNNGNSTLTTVAISSSNSASGFTSVVYADLNGNGVLDPAEVLAGPITNITSLAAGASQKVLVQVFAPLGATAGTTNATVVTASGKDPSNVTVSGSATDTTTVIAGSLSIQKLQSLTAGSGYASANLSAKPGTKVYYQITVTNTGTVPVLSVVINDATPASTTYSNGDTTTSPTGVAAFTTDGGTTYVAGGGSAPAGGNGSTGSVNFTIGTLNPGQTAIAYFGVTINP